VDTLLRYEWEHGVTKRQLLCEGIFVPNYWIPEVRIG
jgi:hypothetical protein